MAGESEVYRWVRCKGDTSGVSRRCFPVWWIIYWFVVCVWRWSRRDWARVEGRFQGDLCSWPGCWVLCWRCVWCWLWRGIPAACVRQFEGGGHRDIWICLICLCCVGGLGRSHGRWVFEWCSSLCGVVTEFFGQKGEGEGWSFECFPIVWPKRFWPFVESGDPEG